MANDISNKKGQAHWSGLPEIAGYWKDRLCHLDLEGIASSAEGRPLALPPSPPRYHSGLFWSARHSLQPSCLHPYGRHGYARGTRELRRIADGG